MHVGDLAPDFTLSDQDGASRTLSVMLESGPVVLFFYPAAMTKGCTKESCHFRDLKAEFAALGAQRVGISLDDVAKQKQFSEQHGFDYPLLSDADGAIARAYGVKRALSLLRVRRETFVIGTDRRVIEIVKSELDMDSHANKALAALSADAKG
jgi:peroxiredoxin Q/BCP